MNSPGLLKWLLYWKLKHLTSSFMSEKRHSEKKYKKSSIFVLQTFSTDLSKVLGR